MLSNLLYMSLKLGEPLGNLSIRASRPSERLQDFENVCKFNGLKYSEDALITLSEEVSWLKSKRDALAHSKWTEKSETIESEHDFLIIKTKGKWGKLDEKKLGVRNKKLAPQAQAVTLKQIKEIAIRAEEILSMTRSYYFKFAESNPECESAFLISSNISDTNNLTSS